MNWIKKLTGGYTSSAKVVDGTLVISMPDAISPVVWRMDFGHAKSSAIEVRDNDGHYVLILKTPKGDVNDIAPFDSKAKAVNALMAVSRAMEQGHGQIKPVTATAQATTNEVPQATVAANVNAQPTQPQTAQSGKGQTAAGIIGVLILIGLLFFLFKLSNTAPDYGIGNTSINAEEATKMSHDADEAGVPLSADSFLRGRN